jgi:hypothetical protein
MAKFYLTLFLFIPNALLLAQQPEHEKKFYVDSVGRYYVQAALPLYISVATSPDEKPVTLMKDKTREPIYLEGHGVHALKHHNAVTGLYDELEISADGIAPVTTVSLLNAVEFNGAKGRFFGRGLSASLKAADEMSGPNAVFHAVNNQNFAEHKPVIFDKEGNYDYSFYALDNVGNAEKVKTVKFTVDLTPPESYHNIVSISSEKVISVNSTIYLTLSDSSSGVAKTFYKFDKETYKPYLSGNIPFQYLPDGDHTLTYYSIDRVNNQEAEKTTSFYLDKKAPILSADILGDKFIVGDKVYFSGRTKLKLTAVDNKAGIKEVMYSINETPFIRYNDPFYLPNRSGLHGVKFYANDNTNNSSNDNYLHSVGLIYVDLTGPALTHRFQGPTFLKGDTVYLSPRTKIFLSANDPEAGLQRISYTVDATAAELPYKADFTIPSKGYHSVAYFGYDNVNNRNSKSFNFVVDEKGPEITPQFSVLPDKENNYPSYTTLYLAASDFETGPLKITYSINKGQEMVFATPLTGFSKNKEYTIKVTATDHLNNQTQREIVFKTGRY